MTEGPPKPAKKPPKNPGQENYRAWCFTLNNPTDPLAFCNPPVKWAIWQLEKGENDTVHFQGYIVMEKTSRLSMMKQLPGLERAHFEQRRGNHEQARDYCKKNDSQIGGPWEFGEEPKGKGYRTDVHERMAECQQILKDDGHAGVKRCFDEHFGDACKNYKGFQEYANLIEKPINRDDIQVTKRPSYTWLQNERLDD